MDYKKEIEKKEYDFLRTNEHLGDNIILLGLGGSHAYGTNTENSDLDIRGVALERPQELIGLEHFEDFENKETDTKIYSFNKMCELLYRCNPNIIEILGLEPEHYLYISPIGQKLLDNKDIFLSKKCYYSFTGYARANLKRLQNALARDNYPEAEKNKHISISLESAIDSFNTQHNTDINPAFAYVDENGKLRYRLNIDISAEDFEDFYAAVSNTTRNYKELLTRNRKKDDNHLNKHAAHLVRLMLMCLEILETGEIHTYRKNDLPLLMSIRRGEWMKEDGTMKDEFYDLVDSISEACKKAFEETKLPEKPDYKKIEQFKMEVNREIINKKETTK